MKTKFFLLLAALLLSVSAFAQSESPLKGDVNNDGTVDVADINAIIEIMKNGGGTGEETKYYFSIGTTPVTAENYTTVNGATTTIPTTMEYSATVRNYYYILIPSTKTLTIIGKATNAPIEITEQTSAGISGHKLYKTNGALSVGGTVVITLSDGTGEETKYYFSIGTNAVTASNYTTVNNATTTIPTTQTFWNNSGSKSLIYVLVPSNKTVTCVDASLNLPIGMVDAGVTITNHKVYVTDGKIANGGGIKITIS